MGLLKKLGIMEDVEPKVEQNFMPLEMYEAPTRIVEFEANGLVSIEEIYAKQNLSDMSKSVFKIEEFASNFPKTLPDAVRKQSVIGVLNTAGFPLETLIGDGKKRIEALTGSYSSISTDLSEKIECNVSKIAELEAEIERLKVENTESTKMDEEQRKLVEVEISKIESILKFVEEDVK